MRTLPSLAVFFVLAFSAAAFGAAFPPGAWYAGLDKPTWTPPNWLFGPVWTVLYTMIAVAGWRIWTRFGDARRPVLTVWGGQMVLNALWSWLFFGLHRPDIAFVEIAALWLTIVAVIGMSWRRDRWTASLMAPYLVWVSFASALNLAIWRLNPIG